MWNLIAWTPRNILRETEEGIEEGANDKTLRTIILPRLIRVLAPFHEARAAVVAMLRELAQTTPQVPEWTG